MSNESSSSKSDTLARVRQGDEAAMNVFFQRHNHALARLAGRRMAELGVPERIVAGEDIAASVLGSFFRAIRENRLQNLRGDDGLLRLLRTMTYRKVIDRKRSIMAMKAGGGNLRGESALGAPDDSRPLGMAEIPGEEPTPADIVEMEEECQRLFGLLDDELRAIAQLKVECRSNQEIASLRGCSLATIERRLRMIRLCWGEANEES